MASVPSGGSGGAAAASGGAAAGGAAAAEEKEEEKKEEGMRSLNLRRKKVANTMDREGRVRRGYGFRSFRLKNQPTSSWNCCSGLLPYRPGFWKGLCGLNLLFHVMRVKGRIWSSREGIQPCTLDNAIQAIKTNFFQL